MTSLFQPGDRVRLIHTSDEWTRLAPGEFGTVDAIHSHSGFTQIFVNWDSGSRLAMVPESGDRIELIHRDPRPEAEQTLYGQRTRDGILGGPQ